MYSKIIEITDKTIKYLSDNGATIVHIMLMLHNLFGLIKGLTEQEQEDSQDENGESIQRKNLVKLVRSRSTASPEQEQEAGRNLEVAPPPLPPTFTDELLCISISSSGSSGYSSNAFPSPRMTISLNGSESISLLSTSTEGEEELVVTNGECEQEKEPPAMWVVKGAQSQSDYKRENEVEASSNSILVECVPLPDEALSAEGGENVILVCGQCCNHFRLNLTSVGASHETFSVALLGLCKWLVCSDYGQFIYLITVICSCSIVPQGCSGIVPCWIGQLRSAQVTLFINCFPFPNCRGASSAGVVGGLSCPARWATGPGITNCNRKGHPYLQIEAISGAFR